MPDSFTRTHVCPESYFLKGMSHTFESNTVYTCNIMNIFLKKYQIVNYDILKWCHISSHECCFFFEVRLKNTIIQVNISWSHSTLLKECRTLEKVTCILERRYLLWNSITVPRWKTYNICSKYIYGRHGALFLKECCAHLRAVLHSNDTFYKRNAALSVEECCTEVCHNFLKECHILLNYDW